MCISYLLSHEVQSALQSVGHLDLPVSIIDLNTSRPACRKIWKFWSQIKKWLNFQENFPLVITGLSFKCDSAYTSGERKLSWSMRTSRLFFTAALYMGMFFWMDAWRVQGSLGWDFIWYKQLGQHKISFQSLNMYH